jgi:hypothetical protein
VPRGVTEYVIAFVVPCVILYRFLIIWSQRYELTQLCAKKVFLYHDGRTVRNKYKYNTLKTSCQSQSVNRRAETCPPHLRRPAVSKPFLRLTVSLGSVTDSWTVTAECANGNGLEVRLRALTGGDRDWGLGWPGLGVGGIHCGWLVGCPGSDPRLTLSLTGGMRRLSGAWVKPSRLGEGSAGRASALRRIPWHLPCSWGKSQETSVRVAEGPSADQHRT